MNAVLFFMPLIFSDFAVILYTLSQKTKVVACNPRKGEKSPLPLAVFLCLLKMDAGLIRVKIIMVDCLRETLKSFTRSFAGIANLIQSTAFVLQSNGGGYSLLQRNTTMSQTNQTPNDQAPIVLNPQVLARAMALLECAENHAAKLAIRLNNNTAIESELKELELQIALAYNLLSSVVMSGVKANGGK